jgi:hypothetical protein
MFLVKHFGGIGRDSTVLGRGWRYQCWFEVRDDLLVLFISMELFTITVVLWALLCWS